MKQSFLYVLFFFIGALQAKAQTENTSVSMFNDGWEFVKDIDTLNCGFFLSNRQTVGVKWEKIMLPHTPKIEPVITISRQWQGTCFYRKYFILPKGAKNKHIAIQFEAAMHEADVYLNGKHIFKHLGGFLPFYVDITNVVKIGQSNVLLVKLNNQDNPVIPPGRPIKDLDFNYYGGIYRNAWLIIKNKMYVNDAIQANRTAGGGLLIHDEAVSDTSAKIIIQTDVSNDYSKEKTAWINACLIDENNKIVASVNSEKQKILSGAIGTFSQTLSVNFPKLWSPTNPYLYHVRVRLYENTRQCDELITNTGIRIIKFVQGAFYINGKKLTIRGTNRHQEYPYIGYSLSDNAQYRDAWKIKSAGFNFVRSPHYPPSPAFLDACDELGILVMDAIPGWQFFGGPEFQQNSFQNIRDMVRRDRNHPSIVLWEASLNETEMNKDYMDTANKIVHAELPFKDVYSSGWIDYAYDVFIPARQHLGAPDYFKKYNRPKPLLLAEYGDWEYYAQNAGFNQKEYADLKSDERNSRQLRADGQQRLLQQALNFKEAHNDNLSGPVAGDVNWLMFDYKRGYAPDLESSGIMDIFRLPKYSYYFYQSQTDTDYDKNRFGKPMLFIANCWNDLKQKIVKIYSNCDQVELFINNKSLGKKKPDIDQYSANLKHPPFIFNTTIFMPGKLLAIGYLGGRKVVEKVIITPSKPLRLIVTADLSGRNLQAGTNDAIFIYVSIVDKNGTIVPDANNLVRLAIKGNGKIIGPLKINAEAGIATFLLHGNYNPGNIIVKATSSHLASGQMQIDNKSSLIKDKKAPSKL